MDFFHPHDEQNKRLKIASEKMGIHTLEVES